jgi:hypothetical protein
MKASMGKTIVRYAVILACAFGIMAYAVNVRRTRHPNLFAAQSYIEKAIERVSAAQKANEFDMNGHAAKAKELLDQSYSEIKLAALAANANR